MDSAFSYIHWVESSLPLLADEWISGELPNDMVTVLEESDSRQEDLSDAKIQTSKKPKKMEWNPTLAE
ncbi:hypothetical protein BCR43DRAFT_491928 [Syncephalastrum racemosum]|uniref:Uncharacterized protein n=1 Tax=Syncephalastrum racemosum TaxID=13706 RepID=A0A1X2HCQ9_SYNRA|nr:hypothetical protein BCR43DRAFT_491928 [Syncephalastrum racemosum]